MLENTYCPRCKSKLSESDCNVVTDLAQCPTCGSLYTLSTLLSASPPARVPSTPPEGSMIEMTQELDGSLSLYLPKQGFGPMHLVMAGFVTFWIGFVAIWTFVASMAAWWFAAFSLPFWGVGIFLLTSLINDVASTQTLRLLSDGIVLELNRPIQSQVHAIAYSQIEDIRLRATFNRRSSLRTLQPVIFYDKGELPFFEHASERDREWVSAFLSQESARYRR